MTSSFNQVSNKRNPKTAMLAIKQYLRMTESDHSTIDSTMMSVWYAIYVDHPQTINTKKNIIVKGIIMLSRVGWLVEHGKHIFRVLCKCF
jgi:hypothetical protein